MMSMAVEPKAKGDEDKSVLDYKDLLKKIQLSVLKECRDRANGYLW